MKKWKINQNSTVKGSIENTRKEQVNKDSEQTITSTKELTEEVLLEELLFLSIFAVLAN